VKFSRTTEYALRVMAELARSPRQPHSSFALHRELRIPQKYLQRLLTTLSKRALIRSVLGRTGGFVLARPARRIALADVIEAVEGFARQPQCLFGFAECRLDQPCAMHARWARHQRAVVRTLTKFTLADVVSARTTRARTRRASKLESGKMGR
jgi:Rrf2 family transcriptional regulator, iron-sulfur cluster assembly transcription factor